MNLRKIDGDAVLEPHNPGARVAVSSTLQSDCAALDDDGGARCGDERRCH